MPGLNGIEMIRKPVLLDGLCELRMKHDASDPACDERLRDEIEAKLF